MDTRYINYRNDLPSDRNKVIQHYISERTIYFTKKCCFKFYDHIIKYLKIKTIYVPDKEIIQLINEICTFAVPINLNPENKITLLF